MKVNLKNSKKYINPKDLMNNNPRTAKADKTDKADKSSNLSKISDPSSPSSPLSTLDIKKKKIIQQIRTLLNDYPSVHPLAHKVLISANYRVLYDLHLNLLGLDGIQQKKAQNPKVNQEEPKIQPNEAGRSPNTPVSHQKEIEISNPLEGITQSLERAKRLSEKRRTLRLEEEEKEKALLKGIRQRNSRKNPILNLDMELEIT
jgi:hypothetical protein